MARTGLRNIESRFAFVSAVIALQKKWTAQGQNAQKRAETMVNAVNKELAAYKVPAVRFRFAAQSSAFAAFFSHEEWQVDLDRRAFDATKAPSEADMAELVDSVYHECRHAEQWFLAARFRAGEGWTVQELARFHLRLVVAQQARKCPLVLDSPEEGLAKRLAESLFTKAGVDRIIETQEDLETLEEGSKASPKQKEEARKRLEKLGYLRGKTGLKDLRSRAHRAYQSQFPEADAWDTGRLASELYKHQAWMLLPKVPVYV